MPCYHPLKGWRSKTVNPSGKRSIVFNVKKAYHDLPIEVPCGQCIGCRLERSRQWAIRCMHEASLHERNMFITLTYNDQNLPENGSLVKEHFQKFIKRFRKRYGQIRYFHCGEYGSQFARPHYHACIFGFEFDDKKHYRTINGFRIYTSDKLAELWPFGYSTIGAVTFESAAYVARYITKKITGKLAELSGHYDVINYDTGEVTTRQEEYITMSLKPGIGEGWFDKFYDDVYPRDEIIIKGKKMKPPKYYDKLFDLVDSNMFRKIKGERIKKSLVHSSDCTYERLNIREQVQNSKFKQLIRPYETESFHSS